MTSLVRTLLEKYLYSTEHCSTLIAVKIGQQSWTYGELASSIFDILRTIEEKSSPTVYLSIEPSVELTCALLAAVCLDSNVYLIDGNFESHELDHLIDRTNGHIGFTDEKTFRRVCSLTKKEVHWIVVDRLFEDDLLFNEVSSIEIVSNPSNLCFLIKDREEYRVLSLAPASTDETQPSFDRTLVSTNSTVEQFVQSIFIGQNGRTLFLDESINELNEEKRTPRNLCLRLTRWPWFERFSIMLIVVNCLSLSLYQPCRANDQSNFNRWLNIIDSFILILFIVEMFIKIIGHGLFGRKSYLSDSWNRFDLLIIVTGILELIVPGGDQLSLTTIRMIRILRPLRFISRVPSIRILVVLLLDTLPMLVNVVLLSSFVFFVFGILALQLWKGLLRNRCFMHFNDSFVDHLQEIEKFQLEPFYRRTDQPEFICSRPQSDGMNKCSQIPRTMVDGSPCRSDFNESSSSECIEWHRYYPLCLPSQENPFSGAVHFDNICSAWLAIFQVITLENWVTIMYAVQDAHSFWDWIYFVALIVIGSFLTMNLTLAVISTQFSVTKKRESQLIQREKQNQIEKKESLYRKLVKLCDRRRVKILTLLENGFSHCHSIFMLKKGKKKELETILPLTRTSGSCRESQSDENNPITSSDRPRSIVRLFSKKLVEHQYFELAVTVLIVLNTIFMSFEHHGQSAMFSRSLNLISDLFTLLFAVEMLLKITGHGFLKYVINPWNLFDAIIVLIGLVELFENNNTGLTVLRTFRLLRVLRLVRFLPTLRQQIMIMLTTFRSFAAFLLLLCLFVFIFSVLGIHLFGGKFCNLNGLNVTSMRTVDLNCHCCSCRRCQSVSHPNEIIDLKCTNDRSNFDSIISALLTVFQILTQEDWNEILYTAMDKSGRWSALYFLALVIIGNYILLNLLVAIVVESFQSQREKETNHRNAALEQQQTSETSNRVNSTRSVSYRSNYSFFLFSPTNRFRRFLQSLLEHRAFDWTINSFILLNCLQLAIERPSISRLSLERTILNYNNYAFTLLFTIEMIIKSIAQGFIRRPAAYLRSPWNMIDASLVVVSIIDVCCIITTERSTNTDADSIQSSYLSMLRVFRVLRTLRPLTVIHRLSGLKSIVNALLSSLSAIGNIALICMSFFIIFGILGVQLFKGTFYYCHGSSIEQVQTREQCLSMKENQWLNQIYNFDNLIQACLTLFVLSSKDGWVNIMYNGIDAVDVDRQPIENFNVQASIYFISFIIVVSFFVLNMFVGIIVENFHQCQTQVEICRREIDETTSERRRPSIGSNSNHGNLFSRLCQKKYFEIVISIVVTLNIIFMSFEHDPMSTVVEKIIKLANYVFTVLFLVEFIIKLIGLGVKTYFKDNLCFNFRQVLKLLKAARNIQKLLNTIVVSLPQVFHLCILLMLILFIFAILGVELFGRIQCNHNSQCHSIDKHVNFENSGMAMLTLFRITTGDNWSGIMKDALLHKKSSDMVDNYFLSIIVTGYFITFVLSTQFVLINILIAVLLKNLEASNQDDADTNENIIES